MMQSNAINQYNRVARDAHVEGASPHELVKIMFDELLKALNQGAVLIEKGDIAAKSERISRALNILNALDASLDFDEGGDISVGLAQIYGHCKQKVVTAHVRNDADAIKEAKDIIADIADAWSQIGD